MMYAWQQTQWSQLWQANVAGRLPHALLLTGMVGIGKKDFAHGFSQALLCQAITADGVACQSCHLCRLVAGRSHPDVLWVEPEKEGGTIKVDQVRAVSEFINQTALQGGKRIVIVNPADGMNVNAANALLKTLEEPPAGALIMLVTSQPSRLPATVRSRCQHVFFQRPGRVEALSWLASRNDEDWELLLSLANGAPLAAMQLVDQDSLESRKLLFQTLYLLSQKQADPLKSATALSDIELLPLLDFILGWTVDVLRLQIGSDEVLNKDYLPQLTELKQRMIFSRLIKFMEYLQALRAQVSSGFNLNKQLVVETMFIRWMEAV